MKKVNVAPMSLSQEQRTVGSFVGALIGEALAVGPHWYYDLDEQYRDYGTWIDSYTNPKKNRYHSELIAGDLSQSGLLMILMAKSLTECGG